MRKPILIAYTNAVPGQEQEYNDWYDQEHIPEKLRIPGISSVQRYAISESQSPGMPEAEFRYLAIYELNTSVAVALNNSSRASVASTGISPALDSGFISFAYEPLGPRFMAD